MMGRILENREAGRYRVKVLQDTRGAEIRMERLIRDREAIAARLADVRKSLRQWGNVADVARDSLETAILAGDKEAQEAAMVAMADAQETLRSLSLSRSKLESDLFSVVCEMERMANIREAEDVRELWCADYSEELSGEVGLVAVAGKPGALLVAPGGEKTDGELLPVATMGTGMAGFRLLTEPGMEKWRPTFRTGTITAMDDEGLCDVELDPAKSRLRPEVNQNQTDHLSGVPVFYMDCHHEAFAEGDAVLINWQEQKPVIVGFAKEPRPCSSRLWVTFSEIEGCNDFVALCDQRISELERDRAFADHCKDVFIPSLLRLFRSWIGQVFSEVAGVIWGRVTQEHVDTLSAPWIAWRDSSGGEDGTLGHGSYVAVLDRAIQAWGNMRSIARHAAQYLTATFAGHRRQEDDVDKIPLRDAVWILDGCPVDFDTTLLDGGGASAEQERMFSRAAQTAWEEDLPQGCSPEISCELFAGSAIKFFWKAKAGFEGDGTAILFSRGFAMQIPGFDGGAPPEGATLTVTDSNGDLFAFPSPYPVHAVPFQIPPGEDLVRNLTLRVKGRLSWIPRDFGVRVRQASFDEAGVLTDWGRLDYDDNPYTWMGRLAIGITVFTSEVADRTWVPSGFETFAGRYPDHPIVTGRNDARLLSLDEDSKRGDIQDVNDFVNNAYAYAGEAGQDRWRFMTSYDPFGDCEDFAITKIEMLLNRGWNISDLQLQCGWRMVSRRNPATGEMHEQKVGHAWVLALGHIVMNNSGGLTTTESMEELGYRDIVTQQGLTWTKADTGRVYVALPWPHYAFDESAIKMKARLHKGAWAGSAE